MSSVNVNLTPFLKAWVEAKVASGRYNNVSEVVREALRLLQDHDREREARLRDLRAGMQEGLDSGEPAPLEDLDALPQRARTRPAQRS